MKLTIFRKFDTHLKFDDRVKLNARVKSELEIIRIAFLD